jgi:lipoate-protein ligase A
MKLILIFLLACPAVWAQNLTPEEQRALLKEVRDLKDRVNTLEKKDSGQGFKETDYSSKTTAATASPTSVSQEPSMTEEQRKEIMDTVEKYKKKQAEQEKVLKELEDEE